MAFPHPAPASRRRIRAAAILAGFSLAGFLCAAAVAATVFTVSQKGREFRPKEITMQVGDKLRFINDDEDLLHHAYLASEAFSFDSGDQAPGSSYEVTFPTSGTFTILCGIHPKMRLTVTVK